MTDVDWITINSGTVNDFGIGSFSFTVAPNLSDQTRVGTISVGLAPIKIVQTPRIASVSAASYNGESLASGSIAAAFGPNFSSRIEAADFLPLSVTLAGTQVQITDSTGAEFFAPLFFASPYQINFHIPPEVAPGLATLRITGENGATSVINAKITPVAAGLFSAEGNGQGLAAALVFRVKADGSQSYEPVAEYDPTQQRVVPRPIDLGPETDQVYLICFGTGIRNRTSQQMVAAAIRGKYAEVLYAGPQGDLVGLDQINLKVPQSLRGVGEAMIDLRVNGQESNQVKVYFR